MTSRGQRPWKSYQKDFVSRYGEYLDTAKERQGKSEAEVKTSPEYQELGQAYQEEAAAAKARPIPSTHRSSESTTRLPR